MEIEFLKEDLDHVAKQILAQNPQKTILFYGEMGVGKTTLIKSIAKLLGVSSTISSPTFSLVNEYETKTNQRVFHFDFYRIKIEAEALDMGIEEYLYSNNWCFIEWADKIPNLIPEQHSTINLSIQKDGKRKLNFK